MNKTVIRTILAVLATLASLAGCSGSPRIGDGGSYSAGSEESTKSSFSPMSSLSTRTPGDYMKCSPLKGIRPEGKWRIDIGTGCSFYFERRHIENGECYSEAIIDLSRKFFENSPLPPKSECGDPVDFGLIDNSDYYSIIKITFAKPQIILEWKLRNLREPADLPIFPRDCASAGTHGNSSSGRYIGTFNITECDMPVGYSDRLKDHSCEFHNNKTYPYDSVVYSEAIDKNIPISKNTNIHDILYCGQYSVDSDEHIFEIKAKIFSIVRNDDSLLVEVQDP